MSIPANQLYDRSQTQVVIVTLSNGLRGTFYGPLQFDQESVDDQTVKVVDVEISDPVKMANGVSWMLEGPIEEGEE